MRSISLVVAALLIACASERPRIVVTSPPTPNPLDTAPLDVRFADIEIHRMPMLNALQMISTEVRNPYGWNFAFHYLFTPSDGFPNSSNRLVSFSGHDVSARDLLSDLCRQVGWSYTWTIKHYIQFSKASHT
jgi:hypothetical protein